MVQCQDCGDDCQRRTRCPNCGQLVCRWCYHHIHNLELPANKAIQADTKADGFESVEDRAEWAKLVILAEGAA